MINFSEKEALPDSFPGKGVRIRGAYFPSLEDIPKSCPQIGKVEVSRAEEFTVHTHRGITTCRSMIEGKGCESCPFFS